jgi:hypothetical protein
MNDLLKRRLEGIREILLASHHAGAGLPNANLGSERETFIKEFLEKSLPVQYRFGTGCVTDMNNNLSGQLDIVIELPFAPSFQMPNGKDRLYLAESIGAVVEVKSNLSSQWNEAIQTVQKLNAIKRYARGGSTRMQIGSYPSARLPIFVVGYEGWNGAGILEQKMKELPIYQRPDGFLDINAGRFCFFEEPSSSDSQVISQTGEASSLFALGCLVLSIISGRVHERGDLRHYWE